MTSGSHIMPPPSTDPALNPPEERCLGLNLNTSGLEAVISRWFIKKRGRATGIGFGGIFLVPFTGYLTPIVGWRTAFAILGVPVWLIIAPLITLVVRASPEEKGLLPDGETKRKSTRVRSAPGSRSHT